jgi:hypothetical protein
MSGGKIGKAKFHAPRVFGLSGFRDAKWPKNLFLKRRKCGHD